MGPRFETVQDLLLIVQARIDFLREHRRGLLHGIQNVFLNGVHVSGDLIQTSRHRREFRPIPVPLAFEQGILIDQLLFDPTQSLAFFSGAFLPLAHSLTELRILRGQFRHQVIQPRVQGLRAVNSLPHIATQLRNFLLT